jgi:ribosomal protein S18 acetylase RimI-like enzyme
MGKIYLACVGIDDPDIQHIDTLDRKIFPGDDPVVKHGSFWWILWDDAEPIGFCGVRILENQSSGFLYRAGIIPSYRGRGFHKRLIRVREKWCRRQKLKYCVTYVLPTNTGSVNNLLKAGYISYKPKYRFGGSVYDVLYLRKLL